MLTIKSNKISLLLSLSLFLVVSSLPTLAEAEAQPNYVISTITVKNTTEFPVWISFVPSKQRAEQKKVEIGKTPVTVSVYPDDGFGKPNSVFHFGYKDRQKDEKISYDHNVDALLFYLETVKGKHFYTQFTVKFEYDASRKSLIATISSKTI